MAFVELFHVPLKPKVVLAEAATDPLYDIFRTVTEDPLVVRLPFHSWVIV